MQNQLTQNEVMAFNECIHDINEFIRLFENKSLCLSELEMGVMEDGTGFCMETDYIGGCGFPNQPSRMMNCHFYVARDLEDYLNMEIAFPIAKVGNDGWVLKQIFMLLQNQFSLSDEELYFALDKEDFTVYISCKIASLDADDYVELLETIQYVTQCAMHMLTNVNCENKDDYVGAVSQQLMQ